MARRSLAALDATKVCGAKVVGGGHRRRRSVDDSHDLSAWYWFEPDDARMFMFIRGSYPMSPMVLPSRETRRWQRDPLQGVLSRPTFSACGHKNKHDFDRWGA